MDQRAFRRHLSLAWRAIGATPKVVAPHSHPTYSEAELLSRADEFNRNAETYWQAVAAEPDARRHVLNKPVSTVKETPALLYRLGLVLHHLDLGVGMTVLDFGAGSGWLSSMMNRMGCRTIAMDVSRTALQFGNEMFTADARHRMDLDPKFLLYEGREIALPDGSVDRIVCFDSFHHVPNQSQVLREFFRILRPGGRVVMGEPGEGHAHSDQSVYETDVHGVLENDLHLDDLVKVATAAGFHSPRLKPFPDPSSLTFSDEQHAKFMDGDDNIFPLDTVRESLRDFMVLSLSKGVASFDSRNPGILRADIKAEPVRPAASGSGSVVTVHVTNSGDTVWLHEETSFGGFVVLGAHLLNAKRETIARGFVRAYLPRDVKPGESVDIALKLPRSQPDGDGLIQLDMVDDRVAWFEQTGSPTLLLPERFAFATSADPDFMFANLVLKKPANDAAPLRVSPYGEVPVTLFVHNAGQTKWIAGAPGVRGSVVVGVVICDANGEVLVRDHERFRLPRDLNPVERAEIDFVCHAPAKPGSYRLRFDLVNEGISWFESYGTQTPDLPIEVV